MKVIFITNRTLKRFKTIEGLNEILNPRNQDLKITIDGLDELSTRSWELSKALFGEDLTLGLRGEVNRKFTRSSFKEERGVKPILTLLNDTVYVNVSSPSNAFNLSAKDKIILATHIYDTIETIRNNNNHKIFETLEQIFIENTFLNL